MRLPFFLPTQWRVHNLKLANLLSDVSFEHLDTWGDPFPVSKPDWDIVIASDILLCKCYLKC
jgi:hypothetical protein